MTIIFSFLRNKNKKRRIQKSEIPGRIITGFSTVPPAPVENNKKIFKGQPYSNAAEFKDILRKYLAGELDEDESVFKKTGSCGMTEANICQKGFTSLESDIMNSLIYAHNKFAELPRDRDDEMSEWILSLHRLQDLVSNRVVRRDYPHLFDGPVKKHKDTGFVKPSSGSVSTRSK